MSRSRNALVPGILLAACCASPVPDPAVEPPDDADLLRAGFVAKRLCSGLWVNHRQREDFLARDLLLGREVLDRLHLEVDEAAGRVSARLREGAAAGRGAVAVFHPTHGCTLLPPGAEDVGFDTTPVRPRLPPAAEVAWPMGDLDAGPVTPAGVDPAALAAAVDLAFADPPSGPPVHTRALLAVHRGRLVVERYADGFDADSVMLGWSMGKSVTAALVGVAVQRGWLDPEQPAPVAGWQAPGDPRSGVRVRDLLQMSSGLECRRIEPVEPEFWSAANDHFVVYFAPLDVFRFASERPLADPPGTSGRYRNCDPLTLGRIVREAVEAHGESYAAFPQRALFDRIGVRSMVLERDHRGNMILSGYDHATARDWARFGLLHIRDGIWQGERILPEGWVRLVSSPAPGWPGGIYGGLFWINAPDAGPGRLPGVPHDAWYAAGAFGQFVVMIPGHDLVVVRLGYGPNAGAIAQGLGAAIEELIRLLPPAEGRAAA